MGRLATAEEIADLVVYLASNEVRMYANSCDTLDSGSMGLLCSGFYYSLHLLLDVSSRLTEDGACRNVLNEIIV